MPAKSKQRGAIQPHYIVRCGAVCCTNLKDKTAPTLEAAQLMFTALGWLHVEPFGWLCPEHAQEHEVKPLALIPNIELLDRWQLTRRRRDIQDEMAAAQVNLDRGRYVGLNAMLKVIDGELLKRLYE